MAAVLIIDDHSDVRRLLSALVTRCGHHVVCAATGQEAIWLLDARPVDLVLLDVSMPDMNGPDVLRAIREQPSTAELPVVMYGAAAEPALRNHLMSKGANDYWGNGAFHPRQLRERLKQYLPC
jgi:two-component system alkaline phosphatase synthesis response regulator PhoP